MSILLLYFVISIQAILFILYFTGMWVVIEFFQLSFVAVYQIFEAFFRCLIPTRKSLRDQLVLVTGAASGIGKLIALNLAKKGCRLVLWDINVTGLEEVAKEIKELGAKVLFYECDVRTPAEVYSVGEKVKREAGDVTILINNAGIVTGKRLLQCSEAEIVKTFQVNSLAHFWTIKNFLPAMIEKNQGHVVSVASIGGYIGLVGCVDYCASKFAAVGLIDALRREIHGMGKTGINFTTICPYYMDTGMFAGVTLKYPNLPGHSVMDPKFVADKIVDAIQTNQSTAFIPRMAQLNYLLHALLPSKTSDMLIRFLGGDSAMDTFVGHGKKQ